MLTPVTLWITAVAIRNVDESNGHYYSRITMETMRAGNHGYYCTLKQFHAAIMTSPIGYN